MASRLSETRRSLIRKSGIVALGGIGLAGCSSQEQTPPPRESEVFEDIEYSEDKRLVEVDIEERPEVESRLKPGQDNDEGVLSVGSLSPVGVASAKARGRGRRSSGSISQRGRNGRAKWRGGTYVVWYNNHEDDVDEYPASLQWIGLGYLGTTEEYRESSPAAGPVDWDTRIDNPVSGSSVDLEVPEDGWYRVGASLTGPNNRNFGVESVDFEVEDGEIQNRWKISPRL